MDEDGESYSCPVSQSKGIPSIIGLVTSARLLPVFLSRFCCTNILYYFIFIIFIFYVIIIIIFFFHYCNMFSSQFIVIVTRNWLIDNNWLLNCSLPLYFVFCRWIYFRWPSWKWLIEKEAPSSILSISLKDITSSITQTQDLFVQKLFVWLLRHSLTSRLKGTVLIPYQDNIPWCSVVCSSYVNDAAYHRH